VTRYLLAAEADKIQDLLFRSAKLREVAGGSQLLSNFCKQIPKDLGMQDDDIIISDGGSFRILFDTKEAAEAFGEQLAEAYRLTTGGTLTVAEPEPVNDDFDKASEQAHQNLRSAKRWPQVTWQSREHQPYIAFCASCGVGLAVTHQAYHEDEPAQYLCASCRNKATIGRTRNAEKPMGDFLADFYQVVAKQKGISLKDIRWPGQDKNPRTGERGPVEDIAEYDDRRYVAYIVADGNDMGRFFSACKTPEQMRELSQGLSRIVRTALAKPTHLLMERQGLGNTVPVYPLILGGDDIFVLIPAPWALDFARRFAQAYEKEMNALIQKIGLEGVPEPTISVAVVICKNKHPYIQAHQAGEQRLKQAKQMSKRLALKDQTPASTINFEVVLGGRLVAEGEVGKVRSTLRPYWAGDESPNADWGLPVKYLIEQRYELRNIPRKRLAELKDLYDVSNLPVSIIKKVDLQPWQVRLERLLQRIERRTRTQVEHDRRKHRDETSPRGIVRRSLAKLGGTEDKAYWRRIDRSVDSVEDRWYGHGLPDLLEAWDFALDLERPRQDYKEAE